MKQTHMHTPVLLSVLIVDLLQSKNVIYLEIMKYIILAANYLFVFDGILIM